MAVHLQDLQVDMAAAAPKAATPTPLAAEAVDRMAVLPEVPKLELPEPITDLVALEVTTPTLRVEAYPTAALVRMVAAAQEEAAQLTALQQMVTAALEVWIRRGPYRMELAVEAVAARNGAVEIPLRGQVLRMAAAAAVGAKEKPRTQVLRV